MTKSRNQFAGTAAAIGTAVFFVVGTTYLTAAEQEPPKKKGTEETRLQQFPLGAQMSGMGGYEFRGRRVVLPPGGATVEHGHSDRPGMVYLLEGSMTEYRGDAARVLKPGDTLACDANAVHRYVNATDKQAVFWAVDIIKK